MKKLIPLLFLLASCATYKNVEVGGKIIKKETANKKHLDKIHPYGFYASGKYVDHRKNGVK